MLSHLWSVLMCSTGPHLFLHMYHIAEKRSKFNNPRKAEQVDRRSFKMLFLFFPISVSLAPLILLHNLLQSNRVDSSDTSLHAVYVWKMPHLNVLHWPHWSKQHERPSRRRTRALEFHLDQGSSLSCHQWFSKKGSSASWKLQTLN